MKISIKQQNFINEYLIDSNSTQAAIRAGYSAKTAKEKGYQLVHNNSLKNIIDAKLKERAENNGITAEFVLKGIKGIATKGEKESDQLKAYELLGKHLKLFTEKIESDNTNHNIEVTLDKELQDWAK